MTFLAELIMICRHDPNAENAIVMMSPDEEYHRKNNKKYELPYGIFVVSSLKHYFITGIPR